MARSLNKVLLIGHVGADPEIRMLNSGKRVAQLRLATNRRWTKPDGSLAEQTEWHRILVYEDPGSPFQVVERFVRKGDRLYVEGELQYRQTDDATGQKRWFTDIRAREIILLSPRTDARDEEDMAAAGGASSRGAPTRSQRPAQPAEEDFGPAALDEAEDDLPF